MEPIGSASANVVLRPSGGAISNDLAAVLRDGRVLAGEVLASPGDGTLLLALGRHVIAAESQLRLDPGRPFLFEVEESASGIVLRVLGGGEGEESSLIRALRAVVGEDRPLGELLGELVRALRADPGSAATGDLLRLLESLPGKALGSGGERLPALLAALGLAHEAALAGEPTAQTLAALRADLKAELLRALARSSEGPTRAALARTLAGLEAEQLLNLARASTGEPLVLSFPFPDPLGATTARLLVPPRRERGEETGGDDAETARVTLGVELSRLGPVRADLTLEKSLLTVRVSVSREELVERLQRDLTALSAELGGGRAVRVQVRARPLEDAALGEHPLDINYLREHRLLDVDG